MNSHELTPLDNRPINIPERRLDPEQTVAVKIAMDRAIWNLYRGDARWLLSDLMKAIQKKGTGRQRDEGMKLLNRISKRLQEWV